MTRHDRLGSAKATPTAALAAQNATLRALIEIYDRLATSVLGGADATAITATFSELIRQPVLLLDAALRPIASAGTPAKGIEATLRPDPADASAKQILATVDAERRPLKLPALPGWSSVPTVFAPVLAGGETLAYLLVLEDSALADRTELDLLAVQQAATVCALAIIRERGIADTANRLREDLLAGLLLTHETDAAETRRRGGLLGYDAKRAYRVITASALTDGQADQTPSALALRRRVLETLAEQLRAASPQAIVVTRPSELVALIPEGTPTDQPDGHATVTLANAVIERVRRAHPSLALAAGTGGFCRDATEVAASYAQARRALAAAVRFGRSGKVTSFEDLGIFRLLLQVQDPVELHRFADRILGPLVEYDRKHDSDLVRTLRAHLQHNGSLQGAARQLNVHVNTVSYRLQRIQEIARLDLSDADDRLSSQLALKIVEGL